MMRGITKMKNKVMLVDGMALLFRGYFATAFRGNFMKTKEGVPTNGVFQFLRYFLNAVDTFSPTHVICCWDMGSQTFRTDLYDGYKANRDAPPEELIPQFDLIKEVMEAFNTPNIGLKNYEADDCIGTLAHQFGNQGEDVLILSGDLDMLQLVNEQTSVAIMRKGQGNYEVFNNDNFYEKRGLVPSQIIDFKGLTGDSADNYPGVKGIGEKTALKLLQKYDTVDNLLAHVDELTPAMQARVNTNLDMLALSQELAEIKLDTPVHIEMEQGIWKFDEQRVEDKFTELEFKPLHTFL